MENISVKALLLPSRLELVVYTVFSAIFYVFINIGRIIDRFASEPLPREIITPEDYLGTLGFITKYPAVNTAVIVIFWSGVGLLAYTIVWALINAFIEARNEIVVETEYVNKGRLIDRLKAPILKSLLLIALFGWVVGGYKWLMPIMLRRFGEILVTPVPAQLLGLFIPVAVMTALITVGSIIIRAVRHHTYILELRAASIAKSGFYSGTPQA